jgi:hypothetical protein
MAGGKTTSNLGESVTVSIFDHSTWADYNADTSRKNPTSWLTPWSNSKFDVSEQA